MNHKGHKHRRDILAVGGLGLAATALGGLLVSGKGRVVTPARAEAAFPVKRSNVEWRKQLTPAQYDILREEGTERAFTSPLNDEHRHGVFGCAGCAQRLFRSDTKFDSGTGWPSFYQPMDKAVAETTDRSYGIERTEIHCANCGGHLGHVFDDGPRPTGLRYCMNGAAMTFTAA